MFWIARLNAPDDKRSRRYIWSVKHDFVSMLAYNKLGFFVGCFRTQKVSARLDWKEHLKHGWTVEFKKRNAENNATTAIGLEIQSIRKWLNEISR